MFSIANHLQYTLQLGTHEYFERETTYSNYNRQLQIYLLMQMLNFDKYTYCVMFKPYLFLSSYHNHYLKFYHCIQISSSFKYILLLIMTRVLFNRRQKYFFHIYWCLPHLTKSAPTLDSHHTSHQSFMYVIKIKFSDFTCE